MLYMSMDRESRNEKKKELTKDNIIFININKNKKKNFKNYKKKKKKLKKKKKKKKKKIKK